MKHALLICLLLFQFECCAQGKFEWFEDQCLKTGYFDTSQVNYNQIQGVYYTFLINYPQKSIFMAHSPEEIEALNINSLQKEFDELRINTEKMDLPPLPFWQAYRSDRLIWCFKEFELKKQLIQAYSTPKMLNPAACATYSIPLNKDGKTLLNCWIQLVKEQQVNASDSSLIENDFHQKWNSKKRNTWARIEVLNYGWWNCVITYLNQHFENQRKWDEFEKLFHKITNSCDQ